MKRHQKRLRQMQGRSDVDLDDIRKAEDHVAEATARFYAELDSAADDNDDDSSAQLTSAAPSPPAAGTAVSALSSRRICADPCFPQQPTSPPTHRT